MKHFLSSVLSLSLTLIGAQAFSYDILAERVALYPAPLENGVSASRCTLLSAEEIQPKQGTAANMRAFRVTLVQEYDYGTHVQREEVKPDAEIAKSILSDVMATENKARTNANTAEQRIPLSCLNTNRARLTYRSKTSMTPISEISQCNEIKPDEAAAKVTTLMNQLCNAMDERAPLPSREDIGVPPEEVAEAPATETAPPVEEAKPAEDSQAEEVAQTTETLKTDATTQTTTTLKVKTLKLEGEGVGQDTIATFKTTEQVLEQGSLSAILPEGTEG